MMAKSLEDTALYRFHRLLALNEVGGNPAAGALSVANFHIRMQERASQWPHGLTATATHDTKRGEDARARLLTLSELADEWTGHVHQWRELNAELVVASGRSRTPSGAHEYMIYQALLGAWPFAGIKADFVGRIKAFVIKAAREGKQETSWLAPDERYEKGLTHFVERVLDRESSASFIDGFDAFARRVGLIGALNSLAQLTLKATMPGVPDFYQGTEFWDLSLVDPDNRRPVDFAARESALASIGEAPDWAALTRSWPDGRIKLALTRTLLALRSELGDLFTNGAYRPLEVVGPDRREIVAFARVRERGAVIVVTGRFFSRATQEGRRWPPSQAWNASVLAEGFSGIRTVLPAGKAMTGPRLAAAELFEVLPIAVLQAEHAPVKGERPKVRVSAAVK